MNDKEIITSLIELCPHKEDILNHLTDRMKELEHKCWKYKNEDYYDQLSTTKKVYNILKYLLEECNGRTSNKN